MHDYPKVNSKNLFFNFFFYYFLFFVGGGERVKPELGAGQPP